MTLCVHQFLEIPVCVKQETTWCISSEVYGLESSIPGSFLLVGFFFFLQVFTLQHRRCSWKNLQFSCWVEMHLQKPQPISDCHALFFTDNTQTALNRLNAKCLPAPVFFLLKDLSYGYVGKNLLLTLQIK